MLMFQFILQPANWMIDNFETKSQRINNAMILNVLGKKPNSIIFSYLIQKMKIRMNRDVHVRFSWSGRDKLSEGKGHIPLPAPIFFNNI
jgi:hypothetical protein